LASEEQSQGVDLINSSVTKLDSVTQSNAASAEESAAAAEELESQAATLHDLVEDLRSMVTGESSQHISSGRSEREELFFEESARFSGNNTSKKQQRRSLNTSSRLPLSAPGESDKFEE